MCESTKRIVIVGGVAGGASAAARARRLSESAEIILFERGEYISFANCGLPYHIGGAIPNRRRLLVQTPESLHRRFRIDIRVNSEVTAIDRARKTVTVDNNATGTEYEEPYDTLILSPGADPVRPDIPGVEDKRVFTLRNIPDMDMVMRAVEEAPGGTAMVIGAGYIGLEVTEALRERGIGVILVELQPQVMATADPEMTLLLGRQLERHGVDIRLNTSVTGFEPEDGRVRALLSTGETVDADFVVMSVGVRPEVTLARAAGLGIGESGGIAVDDHMRTSDPNIFAVGDAVEVKNFVTGQSAGAHRSRQRAGPRQHLSCHARDRHLQGVRHDYRHDRAQREDAETAGHGLREGLRPPGEPCHLLSRSRADQHEAPVLAG